MAEGKKGVLIYADWIKKFETLQDDEAGRLVKHLFRYINDLNPEPPDRITELSFIDIEITLKRDLIKWEQKAEKSRSNGKLGGRPTTQHNPEEPTGTQHVISEPKEPVIDNVNVIDNVIVIDIKDKEEAKASNASKVIIQILNEVLKKEKGKGFRVLDETKSKNILKIYSSEEIRQAVLNAIQDEYHISKNYQFLTPEFFTRKEKVEKFLNFTPYVKRSAIDNLKDNARKAIESQFKDLSNIDEERGEDNPTIYIPVY